MSEVRSLKDCPVDEIAAYIDGEIAPAREFELDLHFARCGSCNAELNEQKQFLQSLNIGLKSEDEITLPDDFAKIVAANAESSVTGLRRPTERFNAIFIVAGLSLFLLFALGAEAVTAVDQASAIGSFFGHLVYSFFVGLAIIVRNVASQFAFGITAVVLLCVAFAAFSFLVSRRVLRARGV